jgi:hypothetical protein
MRQSEEENVGQRRGVCCQLARLEAKKAKDGVDMEIAICARTIDNFIVQSYRACNLKR